MAEEERKVKERKDPDDLKHRRRIPESEEPEERRQERTMKGGKKREWAGDVAEYEATGDYGSFTPAVLSRLLDEAQEAADRQEAPPEWRWEELQEVKEFDAKKDEGSDREDSQDLKEFDAKDEKGRGTKSKGPSQFFTEELQSLIRERVSGVREGSTVGDLGTLVTDVLNLIEPTSHGCRSRSTDRKFDLFPLPVQELRSLGSNMQPFLPALVGCLNSMHSCGDARQGKVISPAVRGVLKRLESVLQGSHILKQPLPALDFSSFFSQKSLDYTGDEVRLAQSISWASVEASLPPEVGALDIRDFCEGGTLHFINNIGETIVAEEDQVPTRTPSVMIKDGEWETVAKGLVSRGLCKVVCEEELHHVGGRPLLNGLFAVAKDELKDGIPVSRLIMNLKPWNSISRSLTADVGTLPSIVQMGTLYLHDGDVLVTSSEDLRCFFYLFKVPAAWCRFMGFGKEIPLSMVPQGGEHKRWYLAGTVLPMGYLNSVGVAQHIHRLVVRRAMGPIRNLEPFPHEIRRDRVSSSSSNLFRVYLDNFDQLQKVDRATAELIAGTPSQLVEHLREFYAQSLLPRHPKKSVEQALEAEVQGAWVDGVKGTISAKPSKVAKYVKLGLELIGRGKASQRELQVVGGGFVYVSMFQRPLLSSLNHIWRSIVEAPGQSPHARFKLRKEVIIELVRFIGLCPLSFFNLRSGFDEMVTASDASTAGGGICKSRGVTPYGHAAGLSTVRGDLPEELDMVQVLSIRLFDGIGALRVGLDALHAPVAGHISVEKNEGARRVVEANFPDSLLVEDVTSIDEEMVKSWALRFSSVGLVLLGAGPPCQGVSGLNSDRKGALKDLRSKLFTEVPRVERLCRRFLPWAQVQTLIENVASMDHQDCETMNKEFECQPWFIDADGLSLAHRPRLYWVSWELQEAEGVEIYLGTDGRLPLVGQVVLKAQVDEKAFLEKGWKRKGEKALPTFTTSRPSSTPLRRPAGIRDCNEEELKRWKADLHRFPPYQYKDCHCLEDRQGNLRTPNIAEREAILGFPPNYTRQCMKKAYHGSDTHNDCRLTLAGNSWSVGVVTWLISQLLRPLGIIGQVSLQDIVDKLTPGKASDLQSLLLRPPLSQGNATLSPNTRLVSKLAGLVSLKGEDVMLQGSSELPVRYHRLRAGVPAKLWRWDTVAGWKWGGDPEHINVLEARAVLTTIKWRVAQRRQVNLRCVHLVDSLVCLHALTRGRSSSRKMRRTMMRINSYLLASGLQPVWAYVDTKENPADRPSRWGVRKRWVK